MQMQALIIIVGQGEKVAQVLQRWISQAHGSCCDARQGLKTGVSKQGGCSEKNLSDCTDKEPFESNCDALF